MTKEHYTALVVLFTLLVLCPVKSMAQNSPPIADAGLSRYTAQDLIVLDGTGSYDPDNSGALIYTWRQISGPSVVIIDANTATPTIAGSMQPGTGRDKTPKPGGFTQTDAIQECEFELEVSDGELTSLPDTVKVIIVPAFGANTLQQLNPPFDPNKPTIVGFGGGYDCDHGRSWLLVDYPPHWNWKFDSSVWEEKANFIVSGEYYVHLYKNYGDMLIVYLSSQAPDYKQPIQTMGLSTGGQPAIDVGIYLNQTYSDRRYAVNRVSLLDATGFTCRNYRESIDRFLASAVEGEQCWIDSYQSTSVGSHYMKISLGFHPNVLNVGFERATDSSITYWERHFLALNWYGNSLTGSDMNEFNNGIVAGAYWSVIGPGKNLQLASTPDAQTYKFKWYGWDSSGYMDFYDEPNSPGRLPEPVTLVGPADGAFVDANGALLSCEESENAVGYQLLFGPDPYSLVYLFSDTPSPPTEIITTFPFEETWWTVKVRDQYGSTIYADPIRINAENVTPPAQNSRPIADAGLSRYAAQDPVVLDGTGSYDPDDSGPLSYAWRQIAGQSIIITDANTATPTISGFTQTSDIQECEFELVVSDGELTSLPDTVEVIIVPAMIDYPDPDNKASSMEIVTGAFDPEKPTLVFFGGGWCSYGGWGWPVEYLREWHYNANFINFPWYEPDRPAAIYTYDGCANMLLTYLSSVAPDYKKPIQIRGHSTGAMPAIGVANYLNTTYGDARYAVNRVSLFDAGSSSGCHDVRPEVAAFCANPIDGEQCWVDNYYSRDPRSPIKAALNVYFPQNQHRAPFYWNYWSLDEATWLTDIYNGGVTAGLYLSVIGPGKNLQLRTELDSIKYYFKWQGNYYPDTQPHPTFSAGDMDFYDEEQNPGRLPEPITLVGPEDGAIVDANGALLSCEESENAVGYQLLFGPDPYSLVYLFSNTPTPPNEVITTFPFEQTWWTVKARDQYGSTIYADPVCIYAEDVKAQTIENASIWKTYSSIQNAINDAHPGDEIVVSSGICQYLENINFKGKNLMLRSTDPNNPAIVAATIINGGDKDSAVTFSNAEDANCVLAGFTITDANNGVYCSGASPTITNCSIAGNAGAGIKLYKGSNPAIANCLIANNGTGIEMRVYKGGRVTIFNYPIITNCTIAGNLQHGISGGIPTITNSIIWVNSPQQIADTQGSVTYSNIQGGWLGEGNIDANPLFADPDNGDYHLKSQAGRWEPGSQSWVIDDVTSPCIDAGDPGTPVGLEPLPNGGIINMGAYGGTAEASKSPAN